MGTQPGIVEQLLGDALREQYAGPVAMQSPAGIGGPGAFRWAGPTAGTLADLAAGMCLAPAAPFARHVDRLNVMIEKPETPEVILEGRRRFTERKVSRGDFEAAAKPLGCEPEVLMAIAHQESGKLKSLGLGAFDRERRPTILYERHYFSRLTGGRHDATHRDLSAPVGYGAGTARDAKGRHLRDSERYGLFGWQYDRLAAAYAIDPEAALKSCSWGMFQIMGENHAMCGFATARAFVLAMCESEVRHLAALVAFLKAAGLSSALAAKDWVRIARGYNGPAFAKHEYDKAIESHYLDFKSGALTP